MSETIHDLIYAIRYQLPIGITTWGNCNNNCGLRARGSHVCIKCLEIELSKIVGSELATDFIFAARLERNVRAKLLEIT